MTERVKTPPDQEQRILALRSAGMSYRQIGLMVGIADTTAFKVCKRLAVPLVRDIEDPLPAGHPTTWGAISGQPWPAGGGA